jgi:hypothetical protein
MLKLPHAWATTNMHALRAHPRDGVQRVHRLAGAALAQQHTAQPAAEAQASKHEGGVQSTHAVSNVLLHSLLRTLAASVWVWCGGISGGSTR